MFGDARRAVIVGGAVLFGLGLLLGFVLGRGGDDPDAEALPSPPTTVSPTASPTIAGSPQVVTPSPGQDPAVTNEGQILRERDRPVVAAVEAAPCTSLVTAGTIGECDDVPVAGGRVIWVVERSSTVNGATAIRTRIFTFVPDAGGWVEWLEASDPAAEVWSDASVLPADLTGDGVPELIVGFRGLGDTQTLEYDVVGYSEDGVPIVLAHRDPEPRGAVVVTGGTLSEYAALYPNGEPPCCPPSYLRRTIVYEAGFFRVVASETIAPNAVPASQV